MQKHLLYIPLIALSSALALTACSDEVTNTLNPDLPIGEKTPIELSVGGVDTPNAATRAVITDGTGKTMKPFDENTKIFMIMESVYDTNHPDFAGSRDTKYTVTRGDVKKKEGDADGMTVEFVDANQKYWDDAHARSTQLSIWAYAQMGQNYTECSFPQITDGSLDIDNVDQGKFKTDGEIGWQTTQIYPAILSWSVGNPGPNQNPNTLLGQDLLFSNNITEYKDPKDASKIIDHRLRFDFDTRKFPRKEDTWGDNGPKKTELKFYHAMSKITIQLKKGDGFQGNGTDFKLKNSTIDKLHGFNTKGLFNLKDGEFQKINESADITSIPLVEQNPNDASKPYYILQALTIPNIHQFLKAHSSSDVNSRFVSGNKNLATDVMMEFTIDDNKYQITSGQLFDALHLEGKPENALVTNATSNTDNGTYIPLEAGKHYIFTFTVGKTKINNITASVVDWETVEAEPQTPSNARIKLLLEERGTEQKENVAFWKLDDNIPDNQEINDNHAAYNWQTGYTQMGAKYNTDHWESDPSVYWQNSKNFIHFRALMPKTTGVTTESSGDYFSISSSSCVDAEHYNQIAWGAPMLDDGDNETTGSFKWEYEPTKYGFDGKISDVEADPAKHQIYKAIGPTENPIKLILFHVMSGVNIIIKTDATKADKVQLVKSNGGEPETFTRTKVDLVGYYKDGKVLLGSGLVNVDGTVSTYETPYNIPFASAASATDPQYADQKYFFSAVPQSLDNAIDNDLDNVKLYITTPDHNQYKVAMNEVLAKTISSNNLANPYKALTSGDNSGKYPIDRWYPGFKYTYTFTLKKTGITDLQVTILDWETVEADDQVVVIQ